MGNKVSFVKKNKPVTKKIWKYLRFLPVPIREKIIRSQFKINYNLSSDYVFKQAESHEEVEAALNIVYESYTMLGYIDTRPERIHFNTYLCLPITTILIVKFKDEVIGTISIVPDSNFGLPSEKTWDLSSIKTDNMKLAEISSLSIKRSHKTSNGHLLLYLCKFMYQYSAEVLQLDGIVIAATEEVEPFYTDLLLFKKVVQTTGQEHSLVKGNKSTCCFLKFDTVKSQYSEVYGAKKHLYNLNQFFLEYSCGNFQFPLKHFSIQGILLKKNKAITQLMEKFPNLTSMFNPLDKLVILNLDPSYVLNINFTNDSIPSTRKHPRVSILNIKLFLYHAHTHTIIKGQIIDISASGLKIKITEALDSKKLKASFLVMFELKGEAFTLHAEVKWAKDLDLGLVVMDKSIFVWNSFVGLVFNELLSENLPQESVDIKDAA